MAGKGFSRDHLAKSNHLSPCSTWLVMHTFCNDKPHPVTVLWMPSGLTRASALYALCSSDLHKARMRCNCERHTPLGLAHMHMAKPSDSAFTGLPRTWGHRRVGTNVCRVVINDTIVDGARTLLNKQPMSIAHGMIDLTAASNLVAPFPLLT